MTDETPRPVPTDIDVLLRPTYATVVNGLAWTFLYCKLRKIGPTTPLRELFPADELELTGADPVPREALVQACRDACARAAGLLDSLDVLDSQFADLRPKPAVENVMARYLEILGDMISTHASGSAPRRPWHWEDFCEGKSRCRAERKSGGFFSRRATRTAGLWRARV